MATKSITQRFVVKDPEAVKKVKKLLEEDRNFDYTSLSLQQKESADRAVVEDEGKKNKSN